LETRIAMQKPKVLVTRRWPEAAEARLRESFDVTLNETDAPMSAEALRNALRDCDAVLPTVTDAMDAGVLSAEPLRCRILANFGVGFNHIDLEVAKARGIVVTNTPDALTDCTADLTLALILMVARRAGEGERELRAGRWSGWRPTHLMGVKVSGKTLGLIGFGRIGQAVAKRAHKGFGMNVIFYTPHPPSAEECAWLGLSPRESLEEVLREADFVSLHCPGGQANRHLIDAGRLALMKPSAFLINAARGEVVDNAALIAALRDKTIAGAGLDVYEGEPKLNPGFLELDNVVLLPHLGSATEETRIAMGMRAIDNLVDFFDGWTPRDKLAYR
jgi:lactate dehydrogenase-like 2-hydroxyacid dehydrogenase